jgi:transcriptional regulator
MYVPPAFRETRVEVLHALIRAHPLGQLVTGGPGGLQVSPLPFQLVEGPGAFGTLRAHLAKANPQVVELEAAGECLVLFQGEQGYVSPSWYPSKDAGGRVVPTWNYALVCARGVPRLVREPDWLRRQLDELTLTQEGRRDPSWSPAAAPEDYLHAQMAAVVGLEIPLADLEGKWKMSQNRTPEDREGVIRGLSDPGDPHGNARLAEEVERSSQES